MSSKGTMSEANALQAVTISGPEENILIRVMGLIMGDLLLTVAFNCCFKTLTRENKREPMK